MVLLKRSVQMVVKNKPHAKKDEFQDRTTPDHKSDKSRSQEKVAVAGAMNAMTEGVSSLLRFARRNSRRYTKSQVRCTLRAPPDESSKEPLVLRVPHVQTCPYRLGDPIYTQENNTLKIVILG